MYLDELAPSWRDFHRRLLAHTRILVVDDDASVCHVLSRLLSREGFTVVVAGSVADGWALLDAERFDLALIDAHLPDAPGLSLIERVRERGLEAATVLLTGRATAEMVDGALALGAADYLTKPIESGRHLVSRVRTILDRRTSTRLFEVMESDLSKAMHAGIIEPRAYAALSQELLSFKIALGRRPQVALIDDDLARAEHRREQLAVGRIAVELVASPAEAVDLIGPGGPLVAVVSLEARNALPMISSMRDADGQLEVLACGEAVDLDAALAAVNAGAADFALLGREGTRALAHRVRRLLRRTRRHRQYLHLTGALYRAAREVDPGLAEDLFFSASPADRDYIKRTPDSEL